MTAKQKLQAKIESMKTSFIVTTLNTLAKPWDKYSVEERIVRTHLLKCYEERMGEDAVDSLMDDLEILEESRR